MFRTVPLSIIRSFSLCTQQTCMTYTIAVCTVKKIPDDGQRNCPKHVEFYSKNKFEKLVHLVGFIIRVYHDARSPEHEICILYVHGVAFCSNQKSAASLSPYRATRFLVALGRVEFIS